MELLELSFLHCLSCKKSLKKNINATLCSIEYYV
nr:MAG TPA: hypothetical protein [Caudoviricetes sp.]